jgi:hypothetical protein
MANGGKGGGKGGGNGGGKGGGGKGKKGGGCLPGQIVTMCLDPSDYTTIKQAFDNATDSPGGTDPCPAGSKKVSLECTIAQKLLFGLAIAMQTNVSNKKPKGKKGGK